MDSTEIVPTERSVSTALEDIRVAIALGMNVPSVVGMYMYEAKVEFAGYDELGRSLGFYPSKVEAKAALRDYVVSCWVDKWYAPWVQRTAESSPEYDELMMEWLAEHTVDEVLWCGGSPGTCVVEPHRVKASHEEGIIPAFRRVSYIPMKD